MSIGWVKIHREIEEDSLWFEEPFTKGQAWLDLIIFANHKPNSFFVRGNEIAVGRGQLGWSEVKMAKRWKWSRQKVRRYLLKLEQNGKILQQKIFRITSITTICNYDKYQDDTTDDTTERQQKDNRRYTNKNDKNDKKIVGEPTDLKTGVALKPKVKGAAKRFVPPTIPEIAEYAESIGYKLDAEGFFHRQEACGWRLKNGLEIKNWKSVVQTWKKWGEKHPEGSSDGGYNNGRAGGGSSGRFAARG